MATGGTSHRFNRDAFLHDRPWISPWIKSISCELGITYQVFASQSSGHCDVIATSSLSLSLVCLFGWPNRSTLPGKYESNGLLWQGSYTGWGVLTGWCLVYWFSGGVYSVLFFGLWVGVSLLVGVCLGFVRFCFVCGLVHLLHDWCDLLACFS